MLFTLPVRRTRYTLHVFARLIQLGLARTHFVMKTMDVHSPRYDGLISIPIVVPRVHRDLPGKKWDCSRANLHESYIWRKTVRSFQHLSAWFLSRAFTPAVPSTQDFTELPSFQPSPPQGLSASAIIARTVFIPPL